MLTLYSGTTCPFSQRCRIFALEKGIDLKIINVDLFNKPEKLVSINPYNEVPALIDRDLELFESNIINEYIEDRFPDPQLIPADVAMRARTRLYLHRFEQELFSQVKILDHGTAKEKELARSTIIAHLVQISPVLAKQPYLLGNDFSVLDIVLGPLLWRLGHYQITLPKEGQALLQYAERVFQRPSFLNSLTADEKAMRQTSKA